MLHDTDVTDDVTQQDLLVLHYKYFSIQDPCRCYGVWAPLQDSPLGERLGYSWLALGETLDNSWLSLGERLGTSIHVP